MKKKVLITGQHSYLGTSFENFIKKNCRDWSVESISLHGTEWEKLDFGKYDAIFHVAGKAHADIGKISETEKKEYYKINRDLTKRVARKAKNDGAGQFIYPSSIIIYGDSVPLGKEKVITAKTKPAPANFYGDSKLQADLLVQKLSDDNFHTAVVRLPMVYGAGSKGNYSLLARFAKRLPVFPKVKNARSMIYIENMCQFLCELIENQDEGVFYPQNSQYTSTTEMVKLIAKASGKRIYITAMLNPFVRLAGKIPGKLKKMADKAFGNLVYDQHMSRYGGNSYQKYSLEESIQRIEG